jgi:AraC family transcriptional regulator of adaptative response / DNA-3-methyladenine glycosylase II
MIDLDRDACYRALTARDPRFDGRFFACVTSTGIYCRPICPARTPKLENCIFMPSAAAAHAAGFRPCLRCRPEIAPGLAGWRGTANTVSRALALIAEGALDANSGEGGSVEALADRLGVGARHLRRLFDEHLGAAPVAVAQAHRILFAKMLISETQLPLGEIALASGFGSIRRFNTVMRRTYDRSPRELRRAKAKDPAESAAITLRLPFRPPYHWPAMVGFLAPRAIPGVESVEAERYRRTIAVGAAMGTVEIAPVSGKPYLSATIHLPAVAALGTVVGRLRRLFDLDADPAAIEGHLAGDALLARAIAARPGLRVPGAWDNFELAIRAMLGQQVSVAAATTLTGRLAAAYGERVADGLPGLDRLFPKPEALATADLSTIGMPGARARAISALAAAMVADRELLRSFETLDATVAKLSRLPGIGPWTAQYIALRALREPDAFPASDLGLLRAAATAEGRPSPAALVARAEAWRPWRAYAALHLWMSEAPEPRPVVAREPEATRYRPRPDERETHVAIAGK